MKPISLKLRGAVGIRDGLQLEEIAIDFTEFSPGLVCIVGANGSGKTTVMDNLHPFLELPSRDGTLADHFYLRDSARDFVFEMNGIAYRSNILIDGDTGKTEAYLYRNGSPENDGKIGTYKLAIERLIGSPDLYFKSIFSAQGASGITSLSTAKRKEFFFELLGLQVYEAYFQLAATRIQQMETELAGKKALVEAGKMALAQYNNEEAEMLGHRKQMESLQARLKKNEDELKDLQAHSIETHRLAEVQSRRLQERVQLQKELSILETKLRDASQEYHREVGKIDDQKLQVQQDIQRLNKILDHRDKIVQSVDDLRKLRVENEKYSEAEKGLVAQQQLQTEQELRLQQKLNQRSAELGRLHLEENRLLGEEQRLRLTIQSELAVIARRLSDARQIATPIAAAPCKTSNDLYQNCALLMNARKAYEEIPKLELKEQLLQSQEYFNNSGAKELEEDLENVRTARQLLVEEDQIAVACDSPAMISTTMQYDKQAHSETKRQISRYENEKWEELAVELQVAESVLQEKENLLQRMSSEKTVLESHFNSLAQDMETQVREKREAISSDDDSADYGALEKECARKIAMVEHSLDEDRKSEIDLRVRITTCERNLVRREEQRKEIAENETLMRECLGHIEHWRLFQRACSKDGIPALELDAAGPAVSDIANDLLASSFGVRFQIAFETTKPSKDGKKQLETFAIKIMGDTGEKHIENLSGGERVWIERAISEAIAIYLSQKSGKEYLTTFQDESDGALDPDNKQNFLRMLQESFRLGRRHFTFIITQSLEIWEQVEQRIHLSRKSGLELIY